MQLNEFLDGKAIIFNERIKNGNRRSNHLKTLVYQRTIYEIRKHDSAYLVYNVVV